MSEENISLYELLNLSIGTPQRGTVNFGALHTLLHTVLRQLDIREVQTRWTDTSPGHGQPGAPLVFTVPEHEEHHAKKEGQIQVVEPGIGHQEQASSSSSPTSSSRAVGDDQERLRSRIQTCEDHVSTALRLIQELHDQKDHLKEEIKELRHQQKVVEAQVETDTAVETCCHRVDALEETVRSLRDTLQKYPDPQQLSQCVTWDVLQAALLSDGGIHQKELVNSGVTATLTPFNGDLNRAHTSPPSSPHPVEDAGRPAAPTPPAISGQFWTLPERTDTRPATEAPSGPQQQTDAATGPVAAGLRLSLNVSERYPETMEALRNAGNLKETFNELEARVAVLQKEKVDQSQLKHLRELIKNKGSQDVSNNLLDQLNEQRALMDGLMSDGEKLDSLEEMLDTSGGSDTDSKALHELRQPISYLRRSVQKLEDDVMKLKAVTEERTDRHLQDQLDDLRGRLEDVMQSLTSELSFSCQDESFGQDESDVQDEAGQDERDGQDPRQSRQGPALTGSKLNTGRAFRRLFKHYEQLQESVNSLIWQQSGGRAGPLKDTENEELVKDVQKAILQLQAECEKLHETTRCLYEDNRQKQSHIEELYKTTEELEEKKADKQMVESEIKADKSALESKVSRLQFDSATEQLNAMFHELLNKVTGQEQDWHKVIDRLSTEMECKLNRIELDSVKKQLEGRWKNIHEKLQAQGAPEHDDAAGLRKQLVDRFHCLSCDRPVVKYTPGPNSVRLPSSPGFPAHKSIRPFTVYALEQFRQHYRSERISELTDYSHLTMSRSCGGSHTITSASQRRTALQSMKLHPQAEVDGAVQSEEVDIIGLDGHIYKGRLNASSIRNTETKLPTISTKDGMCKTKDKAKCSLSHKPSTSPEVGPCSPLHRPHSAKSAQCSRPASSSSGRDWPVSTLGCTSQSSITQASAAAESTAEPPADQPVDL